MGDAKAIADLKRKRGHAKAALTRVESSVTQSSHTYNSQDAIVQLELLDKAYIDFKNLDEHLQDYDAVFSEIEEVEQRYVIVKSKLLTISKLQCPAISQMQSTLNETMTHLSNQQKDFFSSIRDNSTSGSSRNEVKLPRINIPSFNGNYSDFPSFCDLFESTIHNNTNLTDVHKLQLLKGLLKERAAELVKNMSITDSNYAEVWEKVRKRYEKKSPVVTSLIKQFLEMPMANDSVCSQRKIADTCDQVLRGLKVLGTNAERRDPWLIHIVLSKLNVETREQWALKTVDQEFPSFDELLQFLDNRCSALENCQTTPTRKSNTSLKSHVANTSHSSAASSSKSSNLKCPKCENSHHLSYCEQFKILSHDDRKNYVSNNRICFNCLFPGHPSKLCKSKRRCVTCHRKHHSVLHEETPTAEPTVPTSTNTNASATPSIHSNMSVCPNPLLPTALVKAFDRNGLPHLCRVLLDSGSTNSLISESCMTKLKLSRNNARFPVRGISSQKSVTQGCTAIKVVPHFANSFSMTITAYILETLTSDIPSPNHTLLHHWNELRDLHVADPNNFIRGIDMIIGASDVFKVIREGQIMGPDSLIAQNTAFGWVISGGNMQPACQFSMNLQLEFNIDASLQKFWELEEIKSEKIISPMEKQCEDHFSATHIRDDTGKFVVKLPFKSDSPDLGNSVNQAVSRFLSIERKMSRNPDLKREYCSFMEEYSKLGHMVELSTHEKTFPDKNHYYLPHHPVIKETSLTTKLRVVFDGSAVSASNVSLNEKLLIGPTVQPDLLSIIMRFRTHKVAVTADIEKMYRQVRVQDEDAQYQRIVWRENSNLPLRHFKLNTVTYGTSSAPFLATRCLKQLALESEESNLAAANAISEDFYIDDFLSGSQSLESTTDLCHNVLSILESAGFSLRKWASNSQNLLKSLPNNASENFTVDIMKCTDHKVLGLHWDPTDDMLSFKINMFSDSTEYTKRLFLSESSKLFDPLGWLSPATISVKILFQQLWIIHLDWDDPLPVAINEKWTSIRNDLTQLQQIKIKRFLSTSSKQVQLHGFCDASQNAYAAVVFSRALDEFGNIHVNIIASKTRVAPIKQVSIPRLELCAAHLLAKLVSTVRDNMKLADAKIFTWTDSEIVLHWLNNHPSKWKTFVANRTSQIMQLIPNVKWAHVPSAENPADCASRGLLPGELVHYTLWWHGPSWLSQSDEFWPHSSNVEITQGSEVLEERSVKVNHVILDHDVIEQLLLRISSFSKVRRILAFVLKFCAAIKTKISGTSNDHITQFISTAELQAADKLFIKWAQRSDFSHELKELSAKRQILKGKLVPLTPYLDEDGIIRVGGRLTNASCTYSAKHPAILLNSNILSRMILIHLHHLHLHPGPSLLSHISRQSYWIVNVRKLSKQITNKCLICHRLSSVSSSQLMGQLPQERVSPSRPFTHTGLDFAGPILISSKRGRGAKHVKAYIAVFVCLAIKAVHFEAVSELTSDAFIAALKRFVSRRGLSQSISCDNGTNFVGARRKINEDQKELYAIIGNSNVEAFMSNSGIEWKFSPPSAPHFNGLSEAAVRSVKHHLVRSVGQSFFTFEELSTFLCQTEAILNSRPLTPISGDVEDLQVLTPAHFLTTGPLLALPEVQLENVPDNRLNRWQEVKKRVDSFWSRYVKEYLNNLQLKKKWKTVQQNLKVGDIVYVKENLPPLSWPLGRIIEVHSGTDGLVRVATIKTASTIVKRPIVKLVKLPTDDNQNIA